MKYYCFVNYRSFISLSHFEELRIRNCGWCENMSNFLHSFLGWKLLLCLAEDRIFEDLATATTMIGSVDVQPGRESNEMPSIIFHCDHK